MENKLFGTDGIRGVANSYPMTIDIAMQVGKAIGLKVKETTTGHGVVIGKDTRLSGYMLENALAAGICAMGVNVQLVGPLPTPGIAFITASMRADAGVVISASHNQYQDNGIKIFSKDGFKLPDSAEISMENLILSDQMDGLVSAAEDVGKAKRIDDAKGRYIVFLKSTFPRQLSLDGFHIVLDCAHGATYGVAPYVFQELGAKITTIGASPNGRNINYKCGALYPELVAQEVKRTGADLGLAFDGDGDRLIVVDEKGNIIDGDCIMAICANELISRDKLKKNTLVSTVMSNIGLEVAMNRMGGSLMRTDVGDRYVVECMRKQGFSFGGEQSGHLVFLDHITTGDGILAALQLLAVMVQQDKKMSELSNIMESFPQVLKNVRINQKIDVAQIPGYTQCLKSVEEKLGLDGRVLIRKSGTEPVIRVMVEGPDQGLIDAMADDLCEVISKAS